MTRLFLTRLSRRERQIMDILHERGQATAAEVLEALPDPPSYSSVRALLRILEEKGQAQHTEEGNRYVYAPAESLSSAGRNAIEQVVQTFFGGSVERAVSTLLSSHKTRPSDEELERLEEMIRSAKEQEPAAGDTGEGTF